MEPEVAKPYIEAKGFVLEDITRDFGGSSRYVFRIVQDGQVLYAKIPKQKESPYLGKLTHQQEAEMFTLFQETLGLPTPNVVGVYPSPKGDILIQTAGDGTTWTEWIESNNYSREKFLDSLAFLGEDVARMHQVEFQSFGLLLPDKTIHPPGVHNYLDYICSQTKERLNQAEQKNSAFTASEFREITKYFSQDLEKLSQFPSIHTPRLTHTSLSGKQFLVDENGKPSCYFDIESVQAGLPHRDIMTAQQCLIAYFDQATFEEGRERFLSSYNDAGGPYNLDYEQDSHIEHHLFVQHVLVWAFYYAGAKGARAMWAEASKRLLFSTMESGKLDYCSFFDIQRAKEGIPRKPTLP